MASSSPRAARLALAAGDPAPLLPAFGRLLVIGAGGDDDLSALGDPGRLLLVQGFRPDHDALAARGFAVAGAPEGRHDAALVFVPRSRAAARDRVAQAAEATDGPILVDGQKTDGIEPLLKACRARAEVAEPVTKAHGKLFRIAPGTGRFADWRATPLLLPGGFRTVPGVFSADGPDPGSQLLAAALPDRLPPRMADLGAGWGWLAAQVLDRDGVAELHLVEADRTALDCARATITDPRARFHWADATRLALAQPMDGIVMNPPFHVAREGAPALGAAFIAAAARLLGPQGQLWMVANRHLPYEAPLAAAFREVSELSGSAAFKLYRARGPRPRAGRPG